MTRQEAAAEVRFIALKFFRGNCQENRDGFQGAGLLNRLDVLLTFLRLENDVSLQQMTGSVGEKYRGG